MSAREAATVVDVGGAPPSAAGRPGDRRATRGSCAPAVQVHRTARGERVMPTMQIHTVFDPVYGRWQNHVGTDRAGFGGSEDKEQAVAAGRAEAAAVRCDLVVHNEDGTVAHRESYAAGPPTGR
ncbi:DUF2188 domain-containing protein [uncultured Cellulomonas sp.]|uniref:DUF2188 domain-containing protein n=1 Tax=uncultured Cellulomonas sp. TaxID=189682 RepID=UPI0026024AFA|nr:DUF2188 domain-containing protein [uncultured Cellulomonas sp.]